MNELSDVVARVPGAPGHGFTRPTWKRLVALALTALVAIGPRTITSVVTVGSLFKVVHVLQPTVMLMISVTASAIVCAPCLSGSVPAITALWTSYVFVITKSMKSRATGVHPCLNEACVDELPPFAGNRLPVSAIPYSNRHSHTTRPALLRRLRT